MKTTYRLAVATLILACSTGEPADPFLVQTDAGPVRGFSPEGSDDIAAFLGIPFAQAPEGDLRWRSPQTVEAWTEPLEANEYRPICPQGRAQLPQSEDCLYLNVWTSADRSDTDVMPVMVWIHGGGLPRRQRPAGRSPRDRAAAQVSRDAASSSSASRRTARRSRLLRPPGPGHGGGGFR